MYNPIAFKALSGLQFNYASYIPPTHPRKLGTHLLTSEEWKVEWTLSQLPGIDPWDVSTVLAAVQQFNHCAMLFCHEVSEGMERFAFLDLET